MGPIVCRLGLGILMLSCVTEQLLGQQTYTWEQIREKFGKTNPNLLAGEINAEESRAQEVTAYLLTNSGIAITADQIFSFPESGLP